MPTTVRDLMTDDVVTLEPDMTLKEVDRVLLSYGVGGGPVVEDGLLVGVVSRTDVLHFVYAEQEEPSRLSGFYTSPFPIPLPSLERMAEGTRRISDVLAHKKVRDIMSTEVHAVSPDDSVRAVAARMARDGIHRVPVVEGESLVGIVTSMDLVRRIGEVGLVGD